MSRRWVCLLDVKRVRRRRVPRASRDDESYSFSAARSPSAPAVSIGVAFRIGAGGPAFLDEPVVRTAGQGEVVDVRAASYRPPPNMMDLAVVDRGVTARLRASTIPGIQHNSLGGGSKALGVIQGHGLAVIENGQVMVSVAGP